MVTSESPAADRDYLTVSEIETLLAAGIRVFLRSGVEVRRVHALPAVAPKCPHGSNSRCDCFGEVL